MSHVTVRHERLTAGVGVCDSETVAGVLGALGVGVGAQLRRAVHLRTQRLVRGEARGCVWESKRVIERGRGRGREREREGEREREREGEGKREGARETEGTTERERPAKRDAYTHTHTPAHCSERRMCLQTRSRTWAWV